MWASERCRDLSRRGLSSLAESSYLLRAAGPRPSKSSGFGKFRRLTLQRTSTSAEVSEPPAHLQVEIGPCQTAGFQLWKRPRRVWHHWTGRALARLLPVGGSYSFTSSPPVAIPNMWLLCLRQDDPGWTPSGPQVGGG